MASAADRRAVACRYSTLAAHEITYEIILDGSETVADSKAIDNPLDCVDLHTADGKWLRIVRNPLPGNSATAVVDVTDLKQAEAALRDSEQRFRDFASSSSDWFWEMGADLRFTWFSDDTEALSGSSPAQMIGKTRRELRHADDDDAAWLQHTGDLQAHRPFRDFHYQTRTARGELVYYRVSGVPIFDAAGTFRGYRGTGCNVTTEVLAERRADQAQQRLRDAIESITHGFALFDADDRLVLCNANYCSVLAGVADLLHPGVTFEALLRAIVARGCILLPEATRETWLETQLQRHQEGPAGRSFQSADGRWMEVREYATADGGRVIIQTDVSERKLAEAALRQKEASLANAQRIAHLGNWDLHVRSNAMSWSEEMYRIFGLDKENVGASYDTFIYAVHPEDREHVDAAIRVALYAGQPYAVEHRVLRPDGSVRIIAQEGEISFDDEGVPLVMVGTVQDMTDRRRVEQQIGEMEERFRTAFETSVDALSISCMRTGRYLDVNAAFGQVFGYSKAEVVGRTSAELGIWFDPEDRRQFTAKLSEEQSIRNLVLQLRRITGEACTVLVSASVCMLADGPHILASIKDITAWKRSETELRKLWAAVEQSSVAIIITDADGRIEYVNPCFTAITGYTRAEAAGKSPSILKSGYTMTGDYRRLWETISNGNDWQGEFCNRRKDGSLFWGGASISPVKSADGTITHFVGIQADITARKRAEQELRASEERFRSLVETSLFGICIERDGQPLFVNQAFATIFGYEQAHEIIALSSLDRLFPSGSRSWAAQQRKAACNGSTTSEYEIRGIRRDGATIWLHAQTRTVPWNGCSAVQTTVVDITLRKRCEDRLQYQVNYDPVCDLPNRTLALDRLSAALAAARRHATMVSILFIDVDHFKKINDTLGHAAGDRFLRDVGQRLKASVREMDTVARLGGDEFVVVLPDVRMRADTETIVNKIVEAISHPFVLDGQEVFVTLSVGAATFPADGDDAEALMRNADAAMYVAKQSGRGTACFFTPELQQRNHNRVRLEVELRHALERNQMTLSFQPLVDIRSSRIVGAEALLRWFSPELGQIGPEKFVHLAEDTGLIVPIGEWVLASACRELRRWIDAGHTDLSLSVNVSGRQFRGPSLIGAVRRALADNALNPQQLELEITESLLIEDLSEAKGTLDRLEACGIRLAVDDFGTGYSSLSYLNRFPLDTMKIDRSFTSGLLTNANQATLVDALIALAHRLHLRVVAEGVETREQLDFLRARGCDLAQGYHFSRPLSDEAFLSLLNRWPSMIAPGSRSPTRIATAEFPVRRRAGR